MAQMSPEQLAELEAQTQAAAGRMKGGGKGREAFMTMSPEQRERVAGAFSGGFGRMTGGPAPVNWGERMGPRPQRVEMPQEAPPEWAQMTGQRGQRYY